MSVPESENEQDLSYYRARYYDPSTGRFVSEDPLSFDSGQNNFYDYVANSPVGSVDPFGLARCTFSLGGMRDTGLLICLPDKPGDPIVIIPANSGNNGDPQHHCQNNPDCSPDTGHGPLPLGPYKWGGPSVSHTGKGGIHLYPKDPNNQGKDGRYLTHWCQQPFGPAVQPDKKSGHFCSEGCIVATPNDINVLNNLLGNEPGSTLLVTP